MEIEERTIFILSKIEDTLIGNVSRGSITNVRGTIFNEEEFTLERHSFPLSLLFQSPCYVSYFHP